MPTTHSGADHPLRHPSPFAFTVTKIVDNYFPPDLAAGVRQYQFYKDTQYTLQASVKSLQDKEMRYLEGAMEVLSGLENANVLGHLLAHEDIISADLLAQNTQVYTYYARLARSFRGDITQSVQDVRVNIRQMPRPPIIANLHREQYKCSQNPKCVDFRHGLYCAHPADIWKSALDRAIQAEANAMDITLITCDMPCPRPHPIVPLYLQRRCFHCGSYGHIRANCPRSKGPLPRM